MAKGNALKNAISSIFNIGASDKITKAVKRVETIHDLTQTDTREMSFDPTSGRRTDTEHPSSVLTSSGHWIEVANPLSILGECVACKEEAAADGQPERVNVIARGTLAGGTCKRCGRCFCSDHGSFDDEGNFFCSDCKFTRKIEAAESSIAKALFSRWMKK